MQRIKIKLNKISDVQEFVKHAMRIRNRIELISDRYVINAKSIMGIFSLDLSNPIELRLYSEDKTLLNHFDKWRTKGE